MLLKKNAYNIDLYKLWYCPLEKGLSPTCELNFPWVAHFLPIMETTVEESLSHNCHCDYPLQLSTKPILYRGVF